MAMVRQLVTKLRLLRGHRPLVIVAHVEVPQPRTELRPKNTKAVLAEEPGVIAAVETNLKAKAMRTTMTQTHLTTIATSVIANPRKRSPLSKRRHVLHSIRSARKCLTNISLSKPRRPLIRGLESISLPSGANAAIICL